MKLKKALRELLEQQSTADLTRMAETIRVLKLIRSQKLHVPAKQERRRSMTKAV
jgi:hypothetical protein